MNIDTWQLHLGNCKELIKDIEDNSIDSIVTDPPYELGFMGKKWDNSGIAYDVELWTECLRVLKPGGHLLAFSGSRTYHRMAVAIEDAGFDIRDQIMWIYGSGFPKSHDVSKAIDKMAGAEREILGPSIHHSENRKPSNTLRSLNKLYNKDDDGKYITAPATEAAKEWNGWGTALKPAHEPICVARKPLIGTVAENVLQYGTGGINIDGCRIHGTAETKKIDIDRTGYKKGIDHITKHTPNEYGELKSNIGIRGYKAREQCTLEHVNLGRWPANLIHDGSEEVLSGFPESISTGGKTAGFGSKTNPANIAFGDRLGANAGGLGDRGSAARFFYCAKASKKDRNEGCEGMEGKLRILSNQAIAEMRRGNTGYKEEHGKLQMGSRQEAQNHHPTVKPTDLMRYLCRLVTPPNGLILDPFTGSGSTGKAAILEGFRFLGFDMQSEYIDIASARIKHAEKIKDNKLFD